MRQSKSLQELYDHLRRFHLSESLYLIGSINAALKFGFKGLYENDIPEYIKNWLKGIPNDHQTRLNIFLASTRLARFLVLSGANDHKSNPLRLEDNSYGEAVDMAGDLYDEPLESSLKKASSSLANNILGRVGFWQFPLQEHRLVPMGRAYMLYITLPSKLPMTYNIDAKMREYFGIGCFEFLATGLVLWIKSNGTLDYNLKIEIKELEDVVTTESQLAFLQLSSGTPEKYRRILRGDDWKKMNKLNDIYSLDPFTQIPAIAVQHSAKFRKDSFVVPQAKYFLDRASTGMFYLLADKEHELAKVSGQAKKNPFRVYFGDVFRQYVLEQLSQGSSKISVIDLDNDFDNPSASQIPDIALLDDKICIVFEVKTSLLTVSSRAFLDEKKLEAEVKIGSFNKAISQLSNFREKILNKEITDPRFKKIETVINVLVGYEDIFTLNSYLLPLLKDHYGDKADSLQLATITDIDSIGTVLQEGMPINEIFQNKLNDPEKEKWLFMQYLSEHTNVDNMLLRKSYRTFMSRFGLPE